MKFGKSSQVYIRRITVVVDLFCALNKKSISYRFCKKLIDRATGFYPDNQLIN